MQRDELLRLDAAAPLTPGELDPDLLEVAGAIAAQRLKDTVLTRFADAPDELRGAVENVAFDPSADVDVEGLLIVALKEQGLSDELIADAQVRVAVFPASYGNTRILPLNVPLEANPLLAETLAQARLERLGTIAGVPAEKTAAVFARGAGTGNLNDDVLEALIASGDLHSSDARRLGFAATLLRLLDGDADRASSLYEALDVLPDENLGAVRRLTSVDASDWQQRLEKAGATAPEGLNNAQYGRLLAQRVETLFPTDALHNRLTSRDAMQLTGALEAVQPLLNARESVFGDTEPDLTTVAPEARDSIETAYRNLRRFVDANAGLGLGSIFEDATTTPTERLERAQARIQLLPRLIDLNPDVELLSLDLSVAGTEADRLNFGPLTKEERTAVTAHLKAYQRCRTLTGELDDAERLLAAGYDSATRIVADPLERFTARTGLPEGAAKKYYVQAQAATETVAGALGALFESDRAGFTSLAVANLAPSAPDVFRQIDGYDDLFGEQAYCRCEHCASLLSPAAYYVDLLDFIESKLLNRTFLRHRANHPLNLRLRRPDLWTIELTCANTDNRIALLEVVDRILEEAIATHSGFAGNLGDRAAVWRHVYRDHLALAADSFAQPFVLALERLEIYLAHFGRRRADIAALLHAGPEVVAAAALRLSKREWELITQPDESRLFLERIYGIGLPFAPDGTIFRIDVQELLRAIAVSRRKREVQLEPVDDRDDAITREDFEKLLATRFVGQLQIQPMRRGPQSVQNDIEYVMGASAGALDRLHRFVRLWRTLDWSIRELDLVLAHLSDAGLVQGIDAAALQRISQLLGLGERFDLPVEELVALIHLLPRIAVTPNVPALFERRFNPPGLVELGGRLPRDDVRFVHPALRDDPAALSGTDWALARLMAGLGVDADQLLEMICGLAEPLGVDFTPAAPEVARGFPLSLANFSLLYRHARLAEMLHLPVATLFRIAALCPEIGAANVGTFDEMLALIDFYDWLRGGPGELEEVLDNLAYLTGGEVEDPDRFLRPRDLADAIVGQAESDGGILFLDTLLADLDGISEAHSREIIATNPQSVVAVGEGRYRLVDDFDPAVPLTIPAGMAVDEPAARSLLAARHASRIVPVAVATALGIATDKAAALLGLSGIALTDPAIARALRGEGPLAPDPLEDLARRVLPHATLLQAAAFDADTAAFIRENADVFALDPAAIDVEAARRIESYRRLASTDRVGTASARRSRDLHEVLAAVTAAGGFSNASQQALARLLDVDAAVSRSLQAHLTLPAQPLAALERLQASAHLAAALGVDGKALALMAEDGYDALEQAAAALWAAVRAKYPDERTWREKSEPFESRILSERRDGLADYLISSDPAQRVPLHRLFNAETGDRLYTTSDLERNVAVSSAKYVSEGEACFVFAVSQPGTVPLHRLMGPGQNGNAYHFYTTSDEERNERMGLGYVSEGEAGWVFAASQPDTYTLHRLATDGGAHLYTTSDSERDRAITQSGYISGPEACWVPRAPFRRREDLYSYFLLDVDVDGCFPTSPLVAAIGSLQLYMHRVLMNLEQDADGNLQVRLRQELREQWEQRKHYRVWQAGREIFLKTENYLAPDLRDDKTPLFEELEGELLQNDIDEQAVQDAYARYLAGFRELAGLSIAGSYHDIDRTGGGDVLHLIGVTSSDPPSFYYRAVENAYHGAVEGGHAGIVWGPWRAMEVQIPVRRVAPVVHQKRLHVFWNEITTTPNNEFIQGKSRFIGYTHRLAVNFTTLRLDGRWTAPQRVSLYGVEPFQEGEGILDDPLTEPGEVTLFTELMGTFPLDVSFGPFSQRELINKNPKYFQAIVPRYERTLPIADAIHTKAREGYTLRGLEWEQVYPESRINDNTKKPELMVIAAGYEFRAICDLFDRKAQLPGFPNGRFKGIVAPGNSSPSRPVLFKTGTLVSFGAPNSVFCDDYAFASLVADRQRLDRVLHLWEDHEREGNGIPKPMELHDLLWFQIDGELLPINGSPSDAVLAPEGQLYLLQSSVREGKRWLLKRLGTGLARDIERRLFTHGIDDLLDLATQQNLSEPHPPIAAIDPMLLEDSTATGRIDFTGSFGTYYREIFLHIPLLIARQLQSQGRYAEAQRWYHKLFDPTATEVIPHDPALTPAENAARGRDRVWRYVEFRGLNASMMQSILTDPQALEAYRRDPFNPHKIARLRLSAYQKSIVIDYVKLLLDWADYLFSQYEQETLNEATMLYATAAEILGERPAQLGKCGVPTDEPRTYERMRARLRRGTVFLTELEQWIWVKNGPTRDKRLPRFTLDAATIAAAANRTMALPSVPSAGDAVDGGALKVDWNAAPDARRPPQAPGSFTPLAASGFELPPPKNGTGGGIGYTLVRQISPGFCVPPNEELLELWDSVEDRLWKLRHCRDITGARRELALFAPEIPPDLLARARTARLAPEDVLGTSTGEVPPYRFSYLIGRAKEHAAAVQALGNALLEALGRRDAEELAELRAIHEQQLLALTTNVRNWQYDAAVATLESLGLHRKTVDDRRAHYQSLLDTGLSPEEWSQRLSQRSALESQTVGTALGIAAGVVHLVAQLGAPTALKYGGKEIGDSLDSFASATHAKAALQSAQGTTAGMEAGFSRREQEWHQQLQAAQDEIAEIDRQITAAQLQRDIARRETKLHDKMVQQNTELREFYGQRFTSVELYGWQTSQLLRLHRSCFGAAYALAQMAYRAFRFERDEEDAAKLLLGPYWEPGRAGLLAGTRLTNDLYAMERRFLETDRRQLEIQQSFSLDQIDPAALLRLKQTGQCEFTVPEIAFDIAYRGHYRRLIRAVTVTVPAVTGPHINVSATLEMLGGKIRRTPESALSEVPLIGTPIIATSNARSDSGVFELSFHNELLNPFEGSGAVESRWRLTMPQTLPQWNYQTMLDVDIELAYTAKDDEGLRGRTEAAIATAVAARPLARAFSLEREFSQPFTALLRRPAGTAVTFEIARKHLPYFLGQRRPTIRSATLAVRPREGQPLGDLRIALNGRTLALFSPDERFGGLAAANARPALGKDLLRAHELKIVDPGDLGPDDVDAADAAIADGRLEDLVLYIEYEVPAALEAPDSGAPPPPVRRARRSGTPRATAATPPRRRSAAPDPLVELRRQAEEQRDGAAAFTLWLRLRDEDRTAAERFLRMGAEYGDIAAAYNLGVLLWRERGELDAGRDMLDRGARGGDPGAMRELGLLLREQGDLHGAAYWLREAVKHGDTEATTSLEQVQRQMTGTGDHNDATGGG